MVLVVVIIGGGFAAWSYSQRQYYVGEENGQVVIFRGVNVKLAGFSMSSVYSRTGIPLGQVTTDDKQQIASTITASGLSDAQKIVSSIRAAANACEHSHQALLAYQSADKTYQAKLAAWEKVRHKHGRKAAGKPPTKPAKPAALPPNCPQQASSGSAGSGSSGTSPSSSPSHSGSASPSGSGP